MQSLAFFCPEVRKDSSSHRSLHAELERWLSVARSCRTTVSRFLAIGKELQCSPGIIPLRFAGPRTDLNLLTPPPHLSPVPFAAAFGWQELPSAREVPP